MPASCSYRLLLEGKPLPDWHHLLTGDRNLIHKLGHSIAGRTVNEEEVFEENHMDWIVDWEGNPP